MKMMFCPACYDIVVLRLGIERKCECGKCSGKYTDWNNAEIRNGIPIGFNNTSFFNAIDSPNPGPMGVTFEAFVIPDSAPTVKRILVKTREEYYE